MTNNKISRRCCIYATSSLLAAIIGTSGFALGEGLNIPLCRRIEPLRDRDQSPVITAMAMDPLGQVLAVAGDDCSIRLLNVADLSERERLIGHRDLLRTLAFRPDGQVLASAGNDGRLTLWDRTQNWTIARQIDHLPTLFSVRFSPDGKQLAAVGFDTQLMLFDDSERPKLHCQCSDLRGLSYTSSGDRLAVVGRSGKLHLFDPRSGQEIGEFAIHTSRVRDIVFLPGTRWFATVAEDGTATIFDLDEYRVRKQVDFLPCKLFTVAAIDKSMIAVAGSDNRIRILNVVSGEVTQHLDIHNGSINSLVYANGYLYSGGFDAQVCKTRIVGGQDERLAEREKPTGR